MASQFIGRQEFVEVEHADLEGTGWVPVEAVEHWKTLGWTPVSEQNSDDEPESEWTPSAVSEEDDTTTRSE